MDKNTPRTPQDEQDYFLHAHQCLSNPEYAQWYEVFICLHKEHNYSLYPTLMQLYKDGYTPQQAHEKYKSPHKKSKKGWSKDKSNPNGYEVVFEGFEQSNTTPVPDILFDQLLDQLTGTELKVLLYIIRRTKGFKKDSDAISLNQFQYGITTKDGKQLDRGCGVKRRQTIVDALVSLEERGYIVSHKTRTADGDNDTTVYQIHFKGVVSKPDYPQDQGGSFKTGLPSFNNGLGVVAKTGLPVVSKSDPQETVIQETVIQERTNEGTPNNSTSETIHSSTPSLSSFSEKDLLDEIHRRELEQMSTISVDNSVEKQASSVLPIATATSETREPVTTRNTSTTPNVPPMDDLSSKPTQRNTEGLDPDFPGILRIDGYWQELGFGSRLPAAKEHWRTLSKRVQSFEEFESLFKHTTKAIKDKQDKHVKPGNMANADILDGWVQEQKRRQAPQEEPEKQVVTVGNRHLQRFK